MDHVVFYTDPQGGPAFRLASGLSEAVTAVEQLRNQEGVLDASVYSLTAVPLEFRAYYQVRVPAAVGQTGHPGVPAQLAPEPAVAADLRAVPDLPGESAGASAGQWDATAASPIAAEPVTLDEAAEPVAMGAAAQPAEAAPVAAVLPEPAHVDGREHRGQRSLGFFAR